MEYGSMKLNRDLTSDELPWLSQDCVKGTTVYEYKGCTYGCIDKGIAVSLVEGETPFFEVPLDALT
jgi:hypothetical protein